MQLTGEPRRGAVIVLDTRDHRVRTAGLVLVAGLFLDARRRGLRMAVAMRVRGRFAGRGVALFGG